MGAWFGPLDGFLRTAVAMLAYFAMNAVRRELGWDPPMLVGEFIVALIALILSALAATRGWSLPKLRLEWDVDGVPVEGDAYDIRSSDPHRRRGITQVVVGAPKSVLSRLVFGRLVKHHPPVEIRATVTPAGLFRFTDDLSAGAVVFTGHPDGFSHTVERLGEVGRTTVVRVLWEPALSQPLVINCDVNYTLHCRSKWGQRLLRLVSLEAPVSIVRLR